MERLYLYKGIVGLERGPEPKNLSVEIFSMVENTVMTHLSVPFDQVSDFEIRYASLRNLELPPAAVGWRSSSFTIFNTVLNLTSEYTIEGSGQRRRTWYWLQVDMERFVI